MTFDREFRFNDLALRSFLLTGAGNGIGRELSKCLLGQGCHLILVDRDEAGLHETGRQLELIRVGQSGIRKIVCDLSCPVERRRLTEQLLQPESKLDGVIHNAAIDPRSSLEHTSLEIFRQVMATNVEPALDVTRDLLPLLRRSRAGRVVMIGSVTFEIGTANLSSYVASKGALLGLTRSLAHELGADGITVNCIAPGAILVQKEVNRRERLSANGHAEIDVTQWQSVQRELLPRDLFGALGLLLSQAGGAITGQTIQVDGGLIHPLAAVGLQALLQE